MRVPGWLGAGALLAACLAGPQAAPVPLEGTATDLSMLAGTWTGSYRSETTGRHGTVIFRLRAGEDTARGEVEMTFSPALALYGEARKSEDELPPPEFCRTIEIAIVRVRGNEVRGTLAPYWDPDCECGIQTVFEGELQGERIAGQFTSRRATGAKDSISGEWFADRQEE
jgi:hypothetical protein